MDQTAPEATICVRTYVVGSETHLVHEPRQQPRLNPSKPLVPADLVERVGGITVRGFVGLLPPAFAGVAAAAAEHQLALQLHAGLDHLHLVRCEKQAEHARSLRSGNMLCLRWPLALGRSAPLLGWRAWVVEYVLHAHPWCFSGASVLREMCVETHA